MQNSHHRNRERALAAAAIMFLLALAIGGGSSRDDMIQYALPQVAAVFLLAVTLFQANTVDREVARGPALFIALVTVLVIAQLIPLPPSIWSALPGRDFYAPVADAAGIETSWRPLSLSPDRTTDSLLSLVPVFATVALVLSMPEHWDRKFLGAVLLLVIASAVLGAFQVAEGPASSLRFYRISSDDAGVGLLANKNHQATLLAMGIPVAAWWGIHEHRLRRSLLPIFLALALVALFLTGAVLTGSRMGLAVCALALVASIALAWFMLRRITMRAKLIAAAVIVALLIYAGLYLVADNAGLERSLENEPRFWIWPRTIDAIATFFPVGSGFGTFPSVFPRFEQIQDLTPQYVNRAHNDFLEVSLEAGLFGVVLMAGYLAWFVSAALKVWRTNVNAAPDILKARACSLAVLVVLVSTLTDYPLRTAIIGCLFTAASLILHRSVVSLRSHSSAVAS